MAEPRDKIVLFRSMILEILLTFIVIFNTKINFSKLFLLFIMTKLRFCLYSKGPFCRIFLESSLKRLGHCSPLRLLFVLMLYEVHGYHYVVTFRFRTPRSKPN